MRAATILNIVGAPPGETRLGKGPGLRPVNVTGEARRREQRLTAFALIIQGIGPGTCDENHGIGIRDERLSELSPTVFSPDTTETDGQPRTMQALEACTTADLEVGATRSTVMPSGSPRLPNRGTSPRLRGCNRRGFFPRGSGSRIRQWVSSARRCRAPRRRAYSRSW